MKNKITLNETIFSIITFGMVMIVISFATSFGANAAQSDTEVSEGNYSMAKVVFPIKDVSQSGKNVSLTIEKNARALEKQSQNVDYSVMKKASANTNSKCPLVNSTAIDKQIKSYNPISGAASLDVTFKTEEMAKKAAAADCLLIRDTEID